MQVKNTRYLICKPLKTVSCTFHLPLTAHHSSMNYHSDGTIDGSTLEDITREYLPITDMTVCWQNLDGFTSEDLSTIEPYLNELGLYQQHCNPFILPPIHQDNVSLLHGATDQILPSSNFTNLAPSQSSTFSIDMQLSPFPFTEQYQQTHDVLLPQQPQNQELSTFHLLSAGLSYTSDVNAQLQNSLQRSLEIPSTSLDGLDSDVRMGALPQSTAEQADGESETVNQILTTIETHNTNESNGTNREAKRLSPFELYNVHRVEVVKPRMRWNPELNECFVQAVNHLGGPDRATPRCILIKMGVDGLTLDHVKSHLQKYRLAKFPREEKEDKMASCLEGKKRNSNEMDNKVQKMSAKESGMLHKRWELQKALHDQNKIIRELQLQTEENGRRLQEFVENQNKMQEAFMQATQSLTLKCKVNTTRETLSQECTSEEDDLPNNDHTKENCLAESNVLLLHKRARLDT